jgi:hypothetical protein
MVIYILTFIGALWGVLTLLSFRVEDEYIQELFESARSAEYSKNATRQSHGSE